MSYADFKKLVDENDVQYVDLRFTDPRGKLQHLSMVVGECGEEEMEEGFLFDGSSIGGWKGINESDMLLKPDLGGSVVILNCIAARNMSWTFFQKSKLKQWLMMPLWIKWLRHC